MIQRLDPKKLARAQKIYDMLGPGTIPSVIEDDFIVIDFFPNVMQVIAFAQANPKRRLEDILPEVEPNQTGWDQDFDADDPEAVETMLAKYEATVVQETEEGITKDIWHVCHPKGSMDCGSPTTPEPIARAAGALFLFLWYEKNIQCDLARDLTCSYWDKRIGRTL